jgi:catechol 2,3-dioxygenase-like lactoylglutathione lyase family enzyme
MKRFHVHVGVKDLEQSIRFYASLFAAEPTVRKPDYAKWMLDDPCVNFAISEKGAGGIDHLGIQAEDADELAEIHGRLETAGADVFEEGQTTCCYAQSEKSWINDPQGVAWETFRTLGESTKYGGCGPAAEGIAGQSSEQPKRSGPCCGPAAV